MVFSLWLAATVYPVYGTCKKKSSEHSDLRDESLLPIKTTFIAV